MFLPSRPNKLIMQLLWPTITTCKCLTSSPKLMKTKKKFFTSILYQVSLFSSRKTRVEYKKVLNILGLHLLN